jgi:hypothetical protein
VETDFPVAMRKSEKYFERTENGVRIKDEYLYVQNQILMAFMEEPRPLD